MAAKTAALTALVSEVRKTFQALSGLATTLHAELGITASMRAVLEDLNTHGAETVPQIARRKNVSRQHIQVNVDALLACGLVATKPNPKHKRSVLIALTRKGENVFAEIASREAPLLAALATALSQVELKSAAQTLAHLRREITQIADKEKSDAA